MLWPRQGMTVRPTGESRGPRRRVAGLRPRAVPWYRFRVAVTDTSPEAAAVQLALYRALGPSGRVQIAVDLSDAVRQTAMDGIRRRHPEYSDDGVSRAFLTLVYGPAKKTLERAGCLREASGGVGIVGRSVFCDGIIRQLGAWSA